MVKEVLLGIDPNEQVRYEIKRHPIGLYAIVAVVSIILALTYLLLFLAVSSGYDLGFMPGVMGLGIFFFAFAAATVIVGYVAANIYTTNELIITDENLIQILQQSLFDRKVSQLNLSKIQDVSVDQEGILSTILGYGTINVETAGEASNYTFRFAPQPNINAKRINEAHDTYINRHSTATNTGSPVGDGI